MAIDIRICQFFDLSLDTSLGKRFFRYQNYYVNETKTYNNINYDFAPFRAEGSVAGLNGENTVLRVLFPNIEYALRLLEAANANRLTQLTLTTVWVTAGGAYTPNQYPEYYIGIGSSISDTTLELRFRSAVDSVANLFPARALNRQNVGILPLDAQIGLR